MAERGGEGGANEGAREGTGLVTGGWLAAL